MHGQLARRGAHGTSEMGPRAAVESHRRRLWRFHYKRFRFGIGKRGNGGTREGGVGCIARIGLALRLSGAATLGPRASSGVDHSGTHSSWFWEGTKMASDKNALFQENKIPPPTLKGYILRRPRAPQNLLLKWKDDAEK